MNFDVEGARKAGYSDTEIADHLASTSKFDAAGARSAGYGDAEIISHLLGKQEPSFASQAANAVGRTVRAGIKGVVSPATMVGDALGMGSTEALNKTLNQIGLPEPQNRTEQVAENIAGAMTGAGALRQLGVGLSNAVSPVTAGVGRTLAASPGMQVASAGSAATAGEVARESGAGVPGQIAASLAGGIAPSAIQAGGAAAVRAAVRGGEAGRQRMEGRLSTLNEAGVEPTVGQAAGTRRTQSLEAGMSKMPGSSGVMAKQAEEAAEAMGKRVEQIAEVIKPGATATKAGKTIETGISNFVDRFKAEQSFLYNKLDSYLPTSTPVDVSNFRAALQHNIQSSQSAENVIAAFRNPKMEQAFQALLKDEARGPLTWESVKQLRSAIGEKISNAGLNPDISRRELRGLYEALSADMRDAAYRAGPEAERAFSRANEFSRVGFNRIETFLDRVTGKDVMEKIYAAAVSPSEIRQGASTINAVMRSLKPDEQDMVKAAFIRRLGEATPGAQNAATDAFSVRTFLSDWAKVSPEAKRTLFAGGTTAKDLDTIARSAEMLDRSSKVFANPSGTAGSQSQQFLLGGAATAALTGHLGTAAALLSVPVMSNVNARLMTNPKFVHWLARSTTVPAAALPSQLNALSQMKLGPDAEKYIEAVKSEFSDTSRRNVPVPQ